MAHIIIRNIVILLLNITLLGCSLNSLKGVHLHDIEKDNLAQELKTQLSEIKLDQVFIDAGKNLDSLLAHEQRIRSEMNAVIFRTDIWEIISKEQSLKNVLGRY